VLFTYKRFEAQGANRTDFLNAVNPAAPLTGVEAVDNKTVVFKLAQPHVGILGLFSWGAGGVFFVTPREAESFDLRGDSRGSGAWYMAENSPSVRLVYKRNPGYHIKDRPYADTIEMPFVTEYAAGLAQLKAGGVHLYPVRAPDVTVTKGDEPRLALRLNERTSSGTRVFFGFKAGSAKAPFRDVRVRQAWVMTWDRDLWIDVNFNVSQFRSAGLELQTAWDTAYPNNFYAGWWLDPQGKDFGPDSRYFKRDIAEAKKLLAAAGYPNGLDYEANLVTNGFGLDHVPRVDTILGMPHDAGFRETIVPLDFNTTYRQNFRDAKGNFDGMCFGVGTSPPEPGEYLASLYHSKGQGSHGWDPEGLGTHKGDPWMDQQLEKMRQEFDVEKRQALAYDFQRYEAKMNYFTRFPGGASTIDVAWPALANRLVYIGGIPYTQEWIDVTKAPIGQG
jgi:peptide/nickel transport system substrate-binding protein